MENVWIGKIVYRMNLCIGVDKSIGWFLLFFIWYKFLL